MFSGHSCFEKYLVSSHVARYENNTRRCRCDETNDMRIELHIRALSSYVVSVNYLAWVAKRRTFTTVVGRVLSLQMY